MKKRLLSLPQYINNDVDQLQPYRAKLMQQQEKTAHTLVHKINHIVANSQATSLILQEISHLLGVALKADCCCLVTTISDESGEVSAANWCSEQFLDVSQSSEILSRQQLLMSSPSIQCATEQLTIEDISTIQKTLAISCQSWAIPMQSVLAIPTRFSGKNNGVICLIKFHAYQWNESEKNLLQAIAPSCAIALAQVAQTQILANQKHDLHKGNQHQILIKRLTTLSLSNLELNQMLQLVISSTAESLEADRGLLILLKYTDPMFRNRQKKQIPKAKATVVGEWTKTQNPAETRLDKLDQSFWLSECGLCQRVFVESGKPIMIDNCPEQKENWKPNPLFAIEEFPATLLMPLENQGNVLGFVVLQQQVARSWQPTELNIVEMVCAQLSNAIIQSQTLRQVQNLVDERTEQLKRSLEVQAKLYERTKQYVEQLQELNELKDEFVSNISDRLRYPLTNMRMSIRNLRLPGISPERQARYLDILESECTKEINLINDLLTLQKLESHQEAPQFETINLNTKINDLVATVEKPFLDQALSVAVDLPKEPLKLQTEIESFDRILQELLNNVSKYSERDTIVHLQATHRVEQEVDQVMIKVTNTGRGISQEEAAYIFDKFRRGKGRWTPGTGLGLALVKSLVQHLHGAIAVESTPIENSHLSEICFTLTLPQFSSANHPHSQQ
ncbi:GAF domain-containing protein [Anabaena sphaerica FACHB-251]|uniref:histidine kinase n=1 Tax=Anabaena sphaerica FACHB-251 TaxID=2692883 RepID=A0A926WGW2_9NOST|nr:GAF domain-containing protein [Anabaena sphaerica]MBD2293246.1 GAF domain-containing protein [Anabaena sphaerica FACHB-251]